MPSTPPHVAIDHLDQLRNPLIFRAILLIGGFCIVMIDLTGASLMASRRGQLDATETSNANMARALASHAERSIKIGDTVLSELVERAEQDPQDATTTPRLHARLGSIVAATPELQELFIYDADGTRRVTSLPTTAPGSNSDREFFRFHLEHPERGTHIGKPIRSRSSGILTIPLSRRIDRPDGSFGGVAMASLKLDFFGRFYDSFDVGTTGTIVLAIDDGILLYRRPFNPAAVGTNVSNSAIFEFYKANGPIGTGMLVAKLDGIERLYSYRHLDGFPMLVAIAQSRDEILHDWWSTVVKTSVLVGLAIVALLLGARRMISQIIVREALEDELRHARLVTEKHNVTLQALANTDSLTGLANRRQFEKALAAEHARARRTGKQCSVILCDVDYFKKFNDHYGHLAGDACLRQVAVTIAYGLRRPADLAARYGGEEFVVILPETDQEGASAVAEEIRARVAAMAIDHADSPFGHVTISLGVHTAGAGEEEPAAWIKAADEMLYEAKAAGRNRVAARQAT